jgi:uncharacterized protein (DUF58 family)
MPESHATSEPIVLELRPPRTLRSRLAGNEGILWVLASGMMLFIGILKGINLVIVMGYVLLALWIINLILAKRMLRGITARRLPHAPFWAGVPGEWLLEVADKGTQGGNWVLLEKSGDAIASWLVVRAGAGGVFRPRVRATFPRAGRYTLEPLRARSTFPFGLAMKSITLAPAGDIIVFPKPARVDGDRLRDWLFRAWMGREEERRKIRRVVEREAEVHGLRDYRAGDSPRRVHWKATARRNRLTVREYEDAAPPRLLVIVDPWLPKKPKPADRKRLEALMSLAAGVCREWRRGAGAKLALVMAGPTPAAIDGPPGPATTERQLVALALEHGGESGDVGPPLGELSRVALTAPALLLSTRPQSPVESAARRVLGRAIAFAHVGQQEGWYRLD